MKKIISNLLVLSVLIGFASCDNEEIVANAQGDAFIITKVADQDTVFGLALHTFGNKAFTSVTATNEADQSFQLASYYGYPYDYYYETNSDAFTADLPEIGDYDFAVSFQSGESVSSTDALTDDVIYPAEITTCEFETDKNQIKLAWNEMTDADFFVIIMTDEDGDEVFIGNSLGGTTKTAELKSTSPGWLSGKSPVSGEVYTIELGAFMYEEQKAGLNIQAKSIAKHTVTWGS